ncbi:MAG: 5-formyltetrahydrofolate cyclo-ligase [Methanomicrobiales archaeon]|nr:5-formyltetrahydrofolate cyclo-ligase [Methanomicrobiales archaeon]
MHRLKARIREEVKSDRALLSPESREQWSARIEERLLPLIDSFTTVMVYVSKPPEVDTRHLIERLLSAGKKVVVPIIEKETGSLRLSYLHNPAYLVRSTFEVPEPIGNEIPARPEMVEMAIIPLIAFDARGSRLGYGAGYYDRFLKKYRHIVTIGGCVFSPAAGSAAAGEG